MNFKVTTNILFRMTPVLTVRTQMLFLLVTSAYMLHQYNMKIYSSANNQDYRWKVGEENDYILQTVGNRRVTYKKGPVLQVNWMAGKCPDYDGQDKPTDDYDDVNAGKDEYHPQSFGWRLSAVKVGVWQLGQAFFPPFLWPSRPKYWSKLLVDMALK